MRPYFHQTVDTSRWTTWTAAQGCDTLDPCRSRVGANSWRAPSSKAGRRPSPPARGGMSCCVRQTGSSGSWTSRQACASRSIGGTRARSERSVRAKMAPGSPARHWTGRCGSGDGRGIDPRSSRIRRTSCRVRIRSSSPRMAPLSVASPIAVASRWPRSSPDRRCSTSGKHPVRSSCCGLPTMERGS